MFVVALLAGIGPGSQPAQAATCGGLLQPPCPSPSPSPSPSPTPTPDPLGTPTVGSCHDLTLTEFNGRTDNNPAVACSSHHTTLTVRVAQVRQGTSRTDRSSIDHQVAHGCWSAIADRVGGGGLAVRTLYGLSLYIPTKTQWAKGARWVRCDLYLYAGNGRIQPLPSNASIGDGTPMDRETKCATSKFYDTPCSHRHQYRATVAIRMGEWNGTKAARSFALHACRKRYPRGGFLYNYPRTKAVFTEGYNYAVCMPPTRR